MKNPKMYFLLVVVLWAGLFSTIACDDSGDGDRDADGDADVDGDGDSDGDTDGDSDSDADGDTDGDSDSDADVDGDGDSDSDADGDSDSDFDSDADGDSIGTTYYCDCSDPGETTGTGTWGDPFVSKADINEASLGIGDDIYFLDGSSCTGNVELTIDWSGEVWDRVTLGCYSAEVVFTCAERPLIQRSSTTGTAIMIEEQRNLTIQDLDIQSTSTGNLDLVTSNGINSPFPGGNDYNGNITVQRCNFENWGHYALAIYRAGDNVIVVDNTFDHNANAIYLIEESSGVGENYYIARNTCVDTVGYYDDGDTKDGHCVGFQRRGNAIIEDNISTDARGAFVVWCEDCTDMKDVVVRNNRSYGTVAAGLQMWGSTIQNNAARWFAYQNIITDSSSEEQRESLRVQDSNVTIGGTRVFNNTIYNGYQGGLGHKVNTDDFSDDVYFLNNIVVLDDDSADSDLFFRSQERGVFGSNIEIDHNLYWALTGDPSASVRWQDDNIVSYDFSNWQSARNRDTNGDVGDPDFTNPGDPEHDYTLRSGSPAIDNGDYLTHVTSQQTSQTVITIANPYWFHGNLGLTDADGSNVEGMLVTFYDSAGGVGNHQDVEVTSVSYDDNTITVTPAVITIYDAGNLISPANTTQVALRFAGAAPDMGAVENEL